MDEKIKVGIAGYGRSGCDIHGAYFKEDPRFEVVAVADELPERREDAARDFNCRLYNHHEELIAAGGFDLLVNATPSLYHVDCSLRGLNAGFHVLSEKPSAPTVADFDRIVETARRNNREFFAFQNSRFYPYFTKIREVIASGALGEIICIRSNWSGFGRRWDWQNFRANLGGNLFNTGPHPLDQAIVLFGDKQPEVFCRMVSRHPFGGDAENFCTLILYGEGPVIEIEISSFLAYPEGDMYNIQGTCGGLTGGQSGLKWRWFDPALAPKQEMWKPWSDHRKYCSEKLDWQEASWSPDDEKKSDAEYKPAKPGIILSGGVYNNIFDVLRSNGKRIITLDQVRRQVTVLESAHKQNDLWQQKGCECK